MPIRVLARNVRARGLVYNVVAVPFRQQSILDGLAGLADDGEGIDWADLINAGTKGAADIIRATKQPAYGAYGAGGYAPGYTPGSIQVSGLGASGGISTQTLLLLGLGAVVMMTMGRR